MDVRCARCGIEYEFDDALISERGTMVRCTECGHQFRVHPNHVIPAEPDEWRVVVSSGRTIVFKTLRELQQGISNGEIGRDATLLRGKLPPRPLGSIAELDPFFPTRAGANRQQSTLTGVAPPATTVLPGAPRPESTTGKVAIARVGLSTIQVSANSPVVEVPARPLGGRKTAMGIGAPTLVIAQLSEPPTQDKPTDHATPPTSPRPVEVDQNVTAQRAAPETKPPLDNSEVGMQYGASDPPTLRDGEVPRVGSKTGSHTPTAKASTSESKPAMKAVVPRPARRTNPTPVTGTPILGTLHSAVNPLESRTPPTPDKPGTEPPPAQRNVLAQFPESSLSAEEATQPFEHDAEGGSLHAVAPPLADGEETSEFNFQAEAKPIDSPLSSPNNSIVGPSIDNGAFVPTIPPMRLTSADALKHSAARADGSRVGRWLMVILLVALVSLATMFAIHKQSQSGGDETSGDAAKFDQRLQSARDALRAGDLSLAHENLQASQAAGIRDARWLTLTARYDIVRADMSWLAVQLADASDTKRTGALQRELSENVVQSLKALKAVESLGSKDPELDPIRLDALRLAGELEKARTFAASLRSNTLTPDLAYSLASLELTQQNPRLKEVFDWLGQARAQDSGLGRAPLVLVLACVIGNRLESARAEVQRLRLAPRAHPLLTEIEAYVRRIADNAEAAQASAPDAGFASVADAGEVETLADVTREGDFRLRLRRAVEALSRNELTRAEQFFRSVLAERPRDTEALTGLGDVARRHGNTANAISYYQRVLANNGQYLPALSALADMKLKTGDRTSAAALYRRIVEQVGESAGYGQSAAQHLRELEGGGSKSGGGSDTVDKPPAPESNQNPPSRTETQELPGNTQ